MSKKSIIEVLEEMRDRYIQEIEIQKLKLKALDNIITEFKEEIKKLDKAEENRPPNGGWNTDKTYSKLALEIINSNPNVWWTTGGITDTSIERGYFDTRPGGMARYQIQTGFCSALVAMSKSNILERRKDKQQGCQIKMINYFRVKSL